MTNENDFSGSIADTIWNYIKNNPNILLSNLEDYIVETKHSTIGTVRTLLTLMTNSGVVVKSILNDKKVLNVNLLFIDSKQALKYTHSYKKHEGQKEEEFLSGYFLDSEIDKINSLRIELFIKRGYYMRFDQIFAYLIKYHEDNITEKTAVVPEPIKIIPDYKNNELSITSIEKASLMDRTLNFFKNMSFSYP